MPKIVSQFQINVPNNNSTITHHFRLVHVENLNPKNPFAFSMLTETDGLIFEHQQSNSFQEQYWAPINLYTTQSSIAAFLFSAYLKEIYLMQLVDSVKDFHDTPAVNLCEGYSSDIK